MSMIDFFSKMKALLILMGFILISSCTPEGNELYLVKNETDFTLPGGLNQIETHYFTNNQVATFWETYANSSGLSDELIGSVFPNRATLTSRFGENLDHIHTISIWVYDTAYNNGTEIFYMEPIEQGDKTEIRMFSNITEVGDWLKEEKVLIEMRIQVRQLIGATRDVRLNMDFAVFQKE